MLPVVSRIGAMEGSGVVEVVEAGVAPVGVKRRRGVDERWRGQVKKTYRPNWDETFVMSYNASGEQPTDLLIEVPKSSTRNSKP